MFDFDLSPDKLAELCALRPEEDDFDDAFFLLDSDPRPPSEDECRFFFRGVPCQPRLVARTDWHENDWDMANCAPSRPFTHKWMNVIRPYRTGPYAVQSEEWMAMKTAIASILAESPLRDGWSLFYLTNLDTFWRNSSGHPFWDRTGHRPGAIQRSFQRYKARNSTKRAILMVGIDQEASTQGAWRHGQSLWRAAFDTACKIRDAMKKYTYMAPAVYMYEAAMTDLSRATQVDARKREKEAQTSSVVSHSGQEMTRRELKSLAATIYDFSTDAKRENGLNAEQSLHYVNALVQKRLQLQPETGIQGEAPWSKWYSFLCYPGQMVETGQNVPPHEPRTVNLVSLTAFVAISGSTATSGGADTVVGTTMYALIPRAEPGTVVSWGEKARLRWLARYTGYEEKAEALKSCPGAGKNLWDMGMTALHSTNERDAARRLGVVAMASSKTSSVDWALVELDEGVSRFMTQRKAPPNLVYLGGEETTGVVDPRMELSLGKPAAKDIQKRGFGTELTGGRMQDFGAVVRVHSDNGKHTMVDRIVVYPRPNDKDQKAQDKHRRYQRLTEYMFSLTESDDEASLPPTGDRDAPAFAGTGDRGAPVVDPCGTLLGRVDAGVGSPESLEDGGATESC